MDMRTSDAADATEDALASAANDDSAVTSSDAPAIATFDTAFPRLAKALCTKPSISQTDAVTLTIGRIPLSDPSVKKYAQPGTCFGHKWMELKPSSEDPEAEWGGAARACVGDARGVFAAGAEIDAILPKLADAHTVWPYLTREQWVGASWQDCARLHAEWDARAALASGAGLDKMCPCLRCLRANATPGSLDRFGNDPCDRPLPPPDPERCHKTKRVDLAADPDLAALELPSDDQNDAPPPFSFAHAFPSVVEFASSRGRYQRVVVGHTTVAGGLGTSAGDTDSLETVVRIVFGAGTPSQSIRTLFSSEQPQTAHAAFAAADAWLARNYVPTPGQMKEKRKRESEA